MCSEFIGGIVLGILMMVVILFIRVLSVECVKFFFFVIFGLWEWMCGLMNFGNISFFVMLRVWLIVMSML